MSKHFFSIMTTTEKTLLVLGIVLSWVFGALLYLIIGSDLEVWTILALLVGGALLWLAPFTLIVLFSSQPIKVPIIAFTLGSLGFFFVTQNVVIGFGIVLLILGFAYWLVRVQGVREGSQSISALHILHGMGVFFTIVALFAAMLYFYSPFASKILLEPKVPEGFFDVIFRTFLGSLTSSFSESGGSDSVDIEQLKTKVRQSTNATLAFLVQRYQQYVPIVFAAGAFLFLRVVLFLFRYILLFVAFLLTKLFIVTGWLHKETIQVPREVVRF